MHKVFVFLHNNSVAIHIIRLVTKYLFILPVVDLKFPETEPRIVGKKGCTDWLCPGLPREVIRALGNLPCVLFSNFASSSKHACPVLGSGAVMVKPPVKNPNFPPNSMAASQAVMF